MIVELHPSDQQDRSSSLNVAVSMRVVDFAHAFAELPVLPDAFVEVQRSVQGWSERKHIIDRNVIRLVIVHVEVEDFILQNK